MLRALLVGIFCLVLCAHSVAQARVGLRAIFWNMENYLEDNDQFAWQINYGLGMDWDASQYTSLCLRLETALGDQQPMTCVSLRSAYHFSEVEYSSAYVATSIGYRRIQVLDDLAKSTVPVGLRVGYRVGLEGYYMDIFLGFNVQTGSGSFNGSEEARGYELNPTSIVGGL